MLKQNNLLIFKIGRILYGFATRYKTAEERLKSNTGTVIAIILLATITIFIFDTVISSLLSSTGFYSYESKNEITETVDETAEDTDIIVEPETEVEDNTDTTE
jgi:hypothetical protein